MKQLKFSILLLLALFLVLLLLVESAPTKAPKNPRPKTSSKKGKPLKRLTTKDKKAIEALYHRSMLEGDILVRNKPEKKPKTSQAPATAAGGSNLPGKFRNAVNLDEYTWPNGVIPYMIDSDAYAKKDLIEKAMNQIMKYTCIRFREKTKDDEFYVRIFKGIGCYASIGRDQDFPEGLVSLGDGCDYVGTVVHELMHVIGYYHEHNRHDRDDYLKIYTENVNPDDVEQFDINKASDERIFTSFDYNSVMLYGPRAFSKDPQNLITMEPKLEGFYMIEVHEKPGLTKLDAESIKKLYKCPS